MKTIYLTAPNTVRPTPRYEKYYRLIAQRYPHARIIEACEEFAEHSHPLVWKARFSQILEDIDMLIFLRNELKYVGAGSLSEILTAHNAGKPVFMAVTDDGDELLLVPWQKLKFSIKNKSNRKNYAMVKAPAYS